jgi:hypothetical protein
MKVNILDAHDRNKHYNKQAESISKACQEVIDRREFGDHPFYIFAHARTVGMDEKLAIFQDDLAQFISNPNYLRKYNTLADVPEKRLIWIAKLLKPKAESNSMLFKAYPGTDLIKIIWMIPARELWEQFEKGKLTENESIYNDICMYINNREKLEEPEDDDPTDEEANAIYKELSIDANYKKSRGQNIIVPDFRQMI